MVGVSSWSLPYGVLMLRSILCDGCASFATHLLRHYHARARVQWATALTPNGKSFKFYVGRKYVTCTL